jgi:hypothetical protein
VDEIIIALVIFIVLYCGFENSRTPKTYFTNCKLTPYTTTSPIDELLWDARECISQVKRYHVFLH